MTLSQARILVVDDEPVLQLTFSILLKQAGATVFSASNGIEGLRVLADNPVDVILSDKHMPEMDGLTMLEALRARGITAPAVFFVNGVASENPATMARLNVARTVTKPLHPEELQRILTEVLAPLPTPNPS